MKRTFLCLLACFPFLLTGCSTNPVTGKNEISLISTEQELAIGKKNYQPYRQAQGGDYVTDPGIQKYVASVGQRIAKVSDRKLPYEFKVLSESVPNAWALPGGKIAINRGLLVELESEAELAAVLGHEIVHAAAKHSAQGMQRGLLLQSALIASSIALSDYEYRQLALTGAQLGAGMVNQKYGRDAEREADYYGMKYMNRAGYNPAKAVNLQQTFLRLSKDKQSNWLTGLFASHPPSDERVQNNQQTLAELGNPQGETGEKTYKAKIARLIKTKPAYEAFDKAETAYQDNDYEKAITLVDKAIKIEPKEALFQGLKGEILAAQGNKKTARKYLDKAVTLNPDYFRFYLARGFVNRDTGNLKMAENDFKKSNQLLPTSEGHYGLGWLAMKQGNEQMAIASFRKASTSDSTIGKAANLYLARLDLPNNPQRYIKTSLGLDSRGYLNLYIKNNAAVEVKNVRVIIGINQGFGIAEKGAYRLRKSLRPGQSVKLSTGLGPIDKKSASRLSSLVTQANIVE